MSSTASESSSSSSSLSWWQDPLSEEAVYPVEGCGPLVVSAWLYLAASGFIGVSLRIWVAISLRAMKRSARLHLFGDMYMIAFYCAMVVYYIWYIAAYIRTLMDDNATWRRYVLMDLPWFFLWLAGISSLSAGGITGTSGFGPNDLRRFMRTWPKPVTAFIIMLHAAIPILFIISTIPLAPALLIAAGRWCMTLIGIGCFWEPSHVITYAQVMSILPWTAIAGAATIIAPICHACVGLDPPPPPLRCDPQQLWTRVAPLIASYRANRHNPLRHSIVQLLPDIARFVEGGTHWTSPERQMKPIAIDTQQHDINDSSHHHDHHHHINDNHDHNIAEENGHDDAQPSTPPSMDIELAIAPPSPLPLSSKHSRLPSDMSSLKLTLITSPIIAQAPSSSSSSSSIATAVDESTSPSLPSSPTSASALVSGNNSNSSDGNNPTVQPIMSSSRPATATTTTRSRNHGSVTMIIDNAVEYATRWTTDIERLMTTIWFDAIVTSADPRTAPRLPARSVAAMARVQRKQRRWYTCGRRRGAATRCSCTRLMNRYIDWLTTRFQDSDGDWT